jgi:hypothetical protein
MKTIQNACSGSIFSVVLFLMIAAFSSCNKESYIQGEDPGQTGSATYTGPPQTTFYYPGPSGAKAALYIDGVLVATLSATNPAYPPLCGSATTYGIYTTILKANVSHNYYDVTSVVNGVSNGQPTYSVTTSATYNIPASTNCQSFGL